MYNLPYFKETNLEVIKKFIDHHPFAFITGCNADNKPVATQIPMMMEIKNGKHILQGHIMKQTDHHKAFLNNPHVLAAFSGPHCYVSGTWYSNPQTASTWNYMTVHIIGMIRFLADAELEEVLRKTTLHFENYNQQSVAIFDNLPIGYTQRLIPAIVAFEIEVTEIDAVFKLSQNQDYESYKNIIKTLQKRGENGQSIAVEMEERINQLFPDNK